MPKKAPNEEIIEKIRAVLSEHPEGIWIREIARKTGISKSAVHVYLHKFMKNKVEETVSVSGLVKLYKLKEVEKESFQEDKSFTKINKQQKIKTLKPKKLKMRKDIDYEKLGLKCGIEIHQQLATKEKLFCSCRTSFSEEPGGEVSRKLRPVAGEMGDIDIAVLHETFKKKEFIYRIYPGESCLVELDSEPPHPLNREALFTSLEIALLLNCEIPDEIQVMRKTVIDGSNTSGFQRTALVGINGFLETSFGKVGIENISLEEESSQILKREETKTVFGLNRLGIPMVEIGTSPDIHTSEQAKEVAEKLGMILRSTGKVRRGLGTIRQDINVSIKKGARNELKGVQELNSIPKIVENEVVRQAKIIKSGKKVSKEVRKVLPDAKTEFLRPLPGAARLYPETDIPPVTISRSMLEKIKNHLPEMLVDKATRIKKQYGLGEEITKQLIKSGKFDLFEEIAKLGADTKIVSMVLTSWLKDLKTRDNIPTEKITDSHLKEMFKNLGDAQISKEALLEILKKIASDPEQDIADLVNKIKSMSLSEKEIEKEIRKIVSENKNLSFGALMGIAMKRFKGKVDGKTVAKLLNEEIKRSGENDRRD